MKIGDQVFRAVLDTGATLSIVARRLLRTFKKAKTVAIRVGDGHTIDSLGGVDVTICLGDRTVTQHCRVLDTDAFDNVIGTDFLRRNPQVKMLSLRRPYSLHCDFGSGLFYVPLELSGQKESGLRYASKTNYRTENYQLAVSAANPHLLRFSQICPRLATFWSFSLLRRNRRPAAQSQDQTYIFLMCRI